MTDDPFGIYKADRKKKDGPSGAAIAGGGATTAGVGYIAGGMPKKEADLSRIDFNATERKEGLRNKGRVAGQMSRAGILGFRDKVHGGGLYDFNQKKTKADWKGAPKDPRSAFSVGRNEGKIAPEVKVIRHMAGGRTAAHAVAGAGLAVAGYGAGKERKQQVKKAWDEKRKGEALEGAGVAGAGIATGGGALLSSQRRAWSKTASRAIDEGGRLAPTTAGRRKSKITGRRTMNPSVTDGAIVRNNLLKDVDIDTARKVGELRGNARQAQHFAHVFGNTGKATFLGGGAASAAAIHHGRKKQQVSKARALNTGTANSARSGHEAFAGLKTKLRNRTSQKATKVPSGEKFGGPRARDIFGDRLGDAPRAYAATMGGMTAGFGGAYAINSKTKTGKEYRANRAKYAENSRQIRTNQKQISKARGKTAYLITDVGTAAAKPKGASRLPQALGAGFGAYGLGVGGAALHVDQKNANKKLKGTLVRQEKKIASQKQALSKADKPLTTTEVKRKKGTQAKLSTASGTLGLTSLGAFAASKAPGSARAVKLVPALKRVNEKKASNYALGLSTAGAGVSGVR